MCHLNKSAVVTNESQARECFNLLHSNVTTVPLPVTLTSTVMGDFICNDSNPYLHRFFCTLYGTDLLWYFNDKIMTSFRDGDPVGHLHQKTYPEPPEEPMFNVTAVLIQVNNSSWSEYNVPFSSSFLTVLPYNLYNVSVSPFNISCNTFCSNDNMTEVCQEKELNIAGVFHRCSLLQSIVVFFSPL